MGRHAAKCFEIWAGGHPGSKEAVRAPVSVALANNCVAVGESCGKVSLLEVQKGRIQHVFSQDVNSPLFCVTSAYGFIWSGHKDKLIRQWNVTTGELYRTMKGHRGPVISFCVMNGNLFSGLTQSDSETFLICLHYHHHHHHRLTF